MNVDARPSNRGDHEHRKMRFDKERKPSAWISNSSIVVAYGGVYAGLAEPTPDWPTPDYLDLRRIGSGVVGGNIRRRGMGIGRRGAHSRLGTELRSQP